MRVKLEELVEEVSERTIISNQYPVLTSSKNGIYLQEDYFKKQVASKDNAGYRVIRKGEFTYRAMSDTGEFYPNKLECADIGIVSPAYPVFKIKDNRILPDYLKYYFKSRLFQKSITAFVQGSTRASMKFGKMKLISIDLPDEDKQNQILNTIGILESIINKYGLEIDHLNNLIKARFVEMFGDKDFDKKPFKDVCEELFAGGDVKRNRTVKDADSNHPYAVFTNGEKDGGLYGYTDVARVTRPSITISGRGTIGFCLVRAEPFYPAIRLIVATPKEGLVTPSYLKYFIDSKDYSGRGASIPQLTIPMIKDEPVPIPPIETQKEFELFIAQADKSKFALVKSIKLLKSYPLICF